MEDLINRSDAIKWFEPYADRGLKIPVETVIQNLKDIPSADKQGEWIDKGSRFECSNCNCPARYITPFCPQCGAKMKGAE